MHIIDYFDTATFLGLSSAVVECLLPSPFEEQELSFGRHSHLLRIQSLKLSSSGYPCIVSTLGNGIFSVLRYCYFKTLGLYSGTRIALCLSSSSAFNHYKRLRRTIQLLIVTNSGISSSPVTNNIHSISSHYPRMNELVLNSRTWVG